MNTPVFEVECDEPEGKVTRKVWLMTCTMDNLNKFFQKAKEFPTLYGMELLNDPNKFLSMFAHKTSEGGLGLNGVFWVVDDFLGMFYLTNIDAPADALVHYTFFDKRHKGREKLVSTMLKYAFDTFKFRRLSAELPAYVTPHTRVFASKCGFIQEGRRRATVEYKGKLFDMYLYGILPHEVVNGSTEN